MTGENTPETRPRTVVTHSAVGGRIRRAGQMCCPDSRGTSACSTRPRRGRPRERVSAPRG